MARVKRGVTAGRRHKKVLHKAKGYYKIYGLRLKSEESLPGATPCAVIEY